MHETTEPVRRWLLIAEDDHDERELLEIALHDVGMEGEARFVGDGLELFSALESTQDTGLVVLDLNMPNMDGRQALIRLKAHDRYRRIPVVVLTSSMSNQDVSFAYEQGAATFITKPAKFDQLEVLALQIRKYWRDTATLPGY